MDGKSLDLLEFPKVRELVAGYTSFEASRELAHALEPKADLVEITGLLAESGEARRLLDEESSFTIGALTDIREPVRLAALGKVLEPLTLLDVRDSLSAARQIRRTLSHHVDDYARLWAIASGITEMPELEKDIDRCFNPSGEILDSASSQLSSIRQKLRRSRETLLARLEATLKSAKGRRIVQEPIITEREGRYVIPVKVEHRKDIRGIVHDMSNTGATLFIEPWSTLELGNELRQLISEEKYEVERILRDLSLKIASRANEIATDIRLVARLDLILAKAKYALRANAVEPTITDGGGNSILKLVAARHPLLGDKAVPMSAELGRDYSVLVITGPNMGGKTVALKTVGLLSAMALSGVPIPASEESVVPLFDGIFADIGDEQSIEQTVSTFSWHVSNIVRIIERSSNRSLVLLDELGASTDPAEGAALARSILFYLLSRKTLTVATTHFDDLKAFAHTTPGLRNASLDFDPVTQLPTYHLTIGVPGGSNALAVAERLGLPASIIDAARKMMGKGTHELEVLLDDLGREKARTQQLRSSIEEERESLRKREADIEARMVKVRAEERRLIDRTRDSVEKEAADLERDIRLAVVELRKARTREGVDKAKAALDAVRRQLKTEVWQPAALPEEKPPESDRIKVGDTVLLKEANLRVTVLSLSSDGSQAEVQAGRARLTLGIDALEKTAAEPGAKKPAFVPVTKQVVSSVSSQLDLRGKRADEVEVVLDTFLNSASVAGLTEVRVIHGFATGTVRKIVREFLSTHPLVRSFRGGDKGEGGDGATVVRL